MPSRRYPDGLGFHVGAQAHHAALTTDTALLEAAERGITGNGAVDRHLTGAHPTGDRDGARHVGGPYRATETVRGVVGDAHRLVVAGITQHGQHRTEHFLLRDV